MAEARTAERWAAALVLAGGIGLMAAWPGWRLSDAPPADVYAQNPELFLAAAETYAQAHGAGERDGMTVVRPPPGAEVPVVARRFEFWPALELQAGERYRLHVMALDTVHSVVVQGREFALLPGQVRMVEITAVPDAPPILQCGEYCGLGHNRMRGAVTVVP